MTRRDIPVRLAMVGCGAAARACHLPAFTTVHGGRLSAVVDTVPERCAEFVESYVTKAGRPAPLVFTSIADALDSFDAAVVAAPHAVHVDVALELLGAGKHVLMEKPVAHTLSAAEDIAAAVAQNPASVFAMAHPRRLFPAYLWVYRLLMSRRLGRISSVRWVEGGPYGWEPYSGTMFNRNLSGGGVLIDSASHIFDTLAWWFGPGLEVVNYADNSRGGVESDAIATLATGATTITVELSRLRNIGTQCTVTGSEGSVVIGTDFPAGECVHLTSAGTELFRGEVPAEPPARDTWEGLFEEQLEDLCRAVRGEVTAPYSSIEDGLVALRLITDCYQFKNRSLLPMPWLDTNEESA